MKAGVYGSKRDAGNILAGAAANKFGLPRSYALEAFGAVSVAGNNFKKAVLVFGLHLLSTSPGQIHAPVTSGGMLNKIPYYGEYKGSYNGIIYGFDKY